MLRISESHAQQIIDHARQEDPNECCGVVASADGKSTHVYRITNTARNPSRYLMDPQEQLSAMLDAEKKGWDLMGFYHSHPRSEAYPSQVDVRMALESGWLDVHYLLVSLRDEQDPQIRAFNIEEDGSIVELGLEVG